MATTQEERWLIEGQLAGAKRSLLLAEAFLDNCAVGTVSDDVVGKVIQCLQDQQRVLQQLDTRLQRLEGGN